VLSRDDHKKRRMTRLGRNDMGKKSIGNSSRGENRSVGAGPTVVEGNTRMTMMTVSRCDWKGGLHVVSAAGIESRMVEGSAWTTMRSRMTRMMRMMMRFSDEGCGCERSIDDKNNSNNSRGDGNDDGDSSNNGGDDDKKTGEKGGEIGGITSHRDKLSLHGAVK
jgi:hypothetical protein